jgi:hypothetical protein
MARAVLHVGERLSGAKDAMRVHPRKFIVLSAFAGALAVGGPGCSANADDTSDETPDPETRGTDSSSDGVATTSSAVSKGNIYWKGTLIGINEPATLPGLYEARVSCDRGISCCVGVEWQDVNGRYHWEWWNSHMFSVERNKEGDTGCVAGNGRGNSEGVNDFMFDPGMVTRIRAMAVDFRNQKKIAFSSWTNL